MLFDLCLCLCAAYDRTELVLSVQALSFPLCLNTAIRLWSWSLSKPPPDHKLWSCVSVGAGVCRDTSNSGAGPCHPFLWQMLGYLTQLLTRSRFLRPAAWSCSQADILRYWRRAVGQGLCAATSQSLRPRWCRQLPEEQDVLPEVGLAPW